LTADNLIQVHEFSAVKTASDRRRDPRGTGDRGAYCSASWSRRERAAQHLRFGCFRL